MTTATQIAWLGAGNPPPNYELYDYTGHCSTCGAEISGDAVHIKEIENPTFTQHADYMPHGDYVCLACAWLFGAGKGKPGNFIATPQKYEQTVISLKSAVTDKRPWLHVIREIANLPADTPVCGVLTTDIKPRLWPRMRAASVGAFGLYVHSMDDDLSDFIAMDLARLIAIIDVIIPALKAKYSKASVKKGLFRDNNRFNKDIKNGMALEQSIAPWRDFPEFLPAVIIAGVS